MTVHKLWAAASAAAVTAVVVAGCSGGPGTVPAAPAAPQAQAPAQPALTAPPAPPAPDAETPAPEPAGSPEAAPDADTRFVAVVVRNGEVVAQGGDVALRQGDHVVLQVSADVSDEIHLHGYDITQPVEPGMPAELEFTADRPGQFEAELEHARLQLVTFQVQ